MFPFFVSLQCASITDIISPELIPFLSSHLFLNASPSSESIISHCPTIFDIPPSFALHRLIANQHRPAVPLLTTTLPSAPHSQNIPQSQSRFNVTAALEIALNTNISLDPYSESWSSKLTHEPLADRLRSLYIHSNESTSSLLADPPDLNGGAVLNKYFPHKNNNDGASICLPIAFYKLNCGWEFPLSLLYFCTDIAQPDPLLPSPSNWESCLQMPHSASARETYLISPSTPPFQLGNLFLSSCPGKKGN